MKETEIERVYLVKYLPGDLKKYKPIQIQVGDFYDSNSVDALKIRKKGDMYEIIKKEKISDYEKKEHVINIKKKEFDALIKATVQNHKKERYFYPFGDKHICEIDIYKNKLNGYVRLEVEFKNRKDMDNFIPPEWFGEEITHINHIIHEDLGVVTFKEMKERFKAKGIIFKKIIIKE